MYRYYYLHELNCIALHCYIKSIGIELEICTLNLLGLFDPVPLNISMVLCIALHRTTAQSNCLLLSVELLIV